MTSHDCIDRVRKLLRTRRVGHGGTLDPLATGVLPIAVGRCTKFFQFLRTDKIYAATIEFGVATDSDDSDGKILVKNPVPWVTQSDVSRVLRGFEGNIQQKPPNISAIKVKGKKLYQLARSEAGIQHEVEPRSVRIDQIDMTDWVPGDFPHASIMVHCGPGTYIRSIARDCGEALRNPDDTDSLARGHIVSLERRRSGAFSIDSSVTLEKLEDLIASDNFEFIAPDYPLYHIPAVVLSDTQVKYWLNGRSFPIDKEAVCFPQGDASAFSSGSPTRVYHQHRFLGISTALMDSTDSMSLILAPKIVLE